MSESKQHGAAVQRLMETHGAVQVMPASFAQQRFWILDQIEEAAAAYTIPIALRLTGDFDVGALQSALDLIRARHEVLRTVFALDGEELAQVILAPAPFPLAHVNLTTLDVIARDAEIYRAVQANANAAFDLAVGPLARGTLLRLAEREHVLLLRFHHSIADGISVGVFFQELQHAYAAFWAGELPSLEPLPLQYPDYAVWQRRTMQGGTAARQIAYWVSRLGDLPALGMQTDYVRPPAQTSSGGKRELVISAELADAVRALARREQATPYMTFLAAFVVLLHRYTGQDDLVVGSITSGRRRAEVEKLIGLFVNTLAIRVSVDAEPSFVELLRRVRERALEAYANEDVPFEQVVEAVQPVRDRSRSPVFQAAFQLLDGLARELTLPGLVVTRVAGVKDTTKFELTLMLHATPDGALRAVCEYSSDLFHESTIDRLLQHYVMLLRSIVANPMQPISHLALMDDAERTLLLEDWNATAVPTPPMALHELILAQVERTPQAIAVEADTADGHVERITFAELRTRSLALAAELRALGVKPGVGVAVCLDRSCDLVVAIVAAMAAGGHYVPLDPAYPADRVQYMLEHSEVPVLVTESGLRERMHLDESRIRVICLDRVPVSAGDAGSFAPAQAAAEDLAYVIYTSGSTGRPKGVMIPHRAVVNYVSWMAREYPVSDADAILQKAPASFDACIWEFFLPLTTGARLVMARPNAHQDPAYLADAVNRFRVSVLQLVPSQLQMMLETPAFLHCTTLRRIFCGGEALPSELLARLAIAMPDVAVVNLYGPTETTVYSTHWALDRTQFDGSAPIGRPIDNTRVFVLDHHDVPVPVGVPGELCIGGRGVARGYLGQSELTAEKFVPDPFASGTMYRTGDLARWRRDGVLEYLGRRDHQVKLRGFRIELGEIETVLARHPAVQASVAIVREDEPGDKRLVAYVVAVGEPHPDAAELRGLVKSRLPEFMVPSSIVFLDALPTNANGKLDRRALPQPDLSAEQDARYVAPRTTLEEQVAAVWAQVLGRSRVGVDDDFFALGGHSLLAMRVIARLQAVVPVRLTIGSIFEARTVAGLAALVMERLATEEEVVRGGADRIPRRTTSGPAAVSQAQETLWLHEQVYPGSAAYNIPIARRIRGPIDVGALQAALDTIVARHEALRTAIVEIDSAPRQIVSPSATVILTVTDASGLGDDAERHATDVLQSAAREPFDLTQAPLARAVLVRISAREHLLAIVVHHIVFDGGSIGVLLRELSVAYDAARAGTSPRLPELPIQLADHAEWERHTMTDERLATELSFWQRYLDGAPGAVSLPTDVGRTGARSGPGARVAQTLPLSLQERVHQLARETECTPFMVLLTAFETVLHRYTAQDDIVVGSPIAGRSHGELQHVIGYFASTVVLRARFDDDPTFARLLERNRRAAIEAYEHHFLPAERLVRELGVSRQRDSLFDVLFVVQDTRVPALALGDATVESFMSDIGAAKVDLTLSLSETEQGLRANVEYRADLFAPETIERLLGHFATLLDAATRDPHARTSALPLLSVGERHQLLEEWAGPRVTYEGGDTLVELLELQMSLTPLAIAVSDESSSATYGALATASDVLARQLRTLGVGAGTLVGVCAERSVELVVALVAILRAGGAYVPFDPEYPRERLAFMLGDANVTVLLTTRALADRLPESRATVIAIDEPREIAADERAIPLPAAHDPGYMIYTSGSTGRPKGALNAHRGIVNRLQWMQSQYRLGSSDVVLQKTPFTFDVSVWEFFWPLLTGARLMMARPSGHRDPAYLAHVIREQRITVCHFVPSMLRAFLAHPEASLCTSLRDVMASGEALAPDLVAEFYRTLPGSRLHNLYGPTECAVDVSYWPCPPAPSVVPIGKPVSNTRLYVLDTHRTPTPIGVPGELYLAGVQVGLGYHNRPDLTEERFIRDDFAPADARQGGKMYKTGDRARWRPDGTVEYLGRLDFQVKVRGFRIELGEIEFTLLQHPSVRDAVVAAREDRPGDVRLVGYVVAHNGERPSSTALRAFLTKSLPEYMVPGAFIFLDALPLSSNGKIDRKALPAPSVDMTPVVAPRTELEHVVADVWSQVLGTGAIGVEQDFFELGGHSLLATRITAQLSRIFRTTLPLRRFFETPTVAGNAQTLVDLAPKPGQAATIARLFLKAQQMSSENRAGVRGARQEHPTKA